MNFPQNLKYTNEHEWIRVEGDIAYVGITDYAQEQLGDIVFVDAAFRNIVRTGTVRVGNLHVAVHNLCAIMLVPK